MPEKKYSVALFFDGKSYSSQGFPDEKELGDKVLWMIYARNQGSTTRMKKLWQSSDGKRINKLAEIVTNHINHHNNGINEKELEKEAAKLGFR